MRLENANTISTITPISPKLNLQATMQDWQKVGRCMSFDKCYPCEDCMQESSNCQLVHIKLLTLLH